jgi:hypothetical protein
MSALGDRGLWALSVAIAISILTYAIRYHSYFLRLPETLDMVSAPRRRFRLAVPVWLDGLLFRSQFEHGCASFTWKGLFRSERHLMFAGGYLGIGLMIILQTAVYGFTPRPADVVPDVEALEIPFLLAFFLVSAARFTFDMPAMLNANWIFRSTIEYVNPSPNATTRRFIRLGTLTVVSTLTAAITLPQYSWGVTAGHIITACVFIVFLVETLFARFWKIPFTCRTEAAMRDILGRILMCLLVVIAGIPLLATFDHWMLEDFTRFSALAVLSGAGWYALLRYKAELPDDKRPPLFDERAPAGFEWLKLD